MYKMDFTKSQNQKILFKSLSQQILANKRIDRSSFNGLTNLDMSNVDTEILK